MGKYQVRADLVVTMELIVLVVHLLRVYRF